jgi:zinc transporter ZupT
MVKSSPNVILAGMVPAIFVAAGAAFGAKVALPPRISGALMTTAAGLITASFMTEIAPDIERSKGSNAKIAAVLGMLGGAILMIGLQQAEEHTDNNQHKERGSAWSLVGGACATFFVDGVLVGQSMATGSTPNRMMFAAMAIESVIVSAAISTSLKNKGKSTKEIGIEMSAIALSSIFGMFVGYKFKKSFTETPTSFLIGVTATASLWMIVHALLPDSYRTLVVKRWWAPALWIGATAAGVSMNMIAGN